MIFDLSGRVALVTGAGRNVGHGIAGMLAAQGAGRGERPRPRAGRAGGGQLGGSAIAVPFDVTDFDSMCNRGWGASITISSGAGASGVAIGVSPYSAGKGGGLALTRTLALEVARSGMTAITIAPVS